MDWKEVGARIAAITMSLAIIGGLMSGALLIARLRDRHEAEELRNQWHVAMEAQPPDINKAFELRDRLYEKLGKKEADKLWKEFVLHPYVQQMKEDYKVIENYEELAEQKKKEFEQKYGIDDYIATFYLSYDLFLEPAKASAELQAEIERLEEQLNIQLNINKSNKEVK